MCLLNFWLYALFLNCVTVLWSHLVWFVVFWFAFAVLYLQIWLRIHFPPKSVLWQFTCSNGQCKSRIFLRLLSFLPQFYFLSQSVRKKRLNFYLYLPGVPTVSPPKVFQWVTRNFRFDPALSKECVYFYCVISKAYLSQMKIYHVLSPVLLTGNGPLSWAGLNWSGSKMPWYFLYAFT